MEKIVILTKKEDIINSIKCCDDAFMFPVLERKNADELINKILKYGIFLAYIDAEILGYCAFYANDYEKNIAFVTLLGVNNNYQGRGIGGKLLETCEVISKEKGMKFLKLEVRKENINAIHLYEKKKFAKNKTLENSYIYMKNL